MRNLLRLTTLRLALLAIAAASATEGLAADTPLSQADVAFINKAAQGGLMEVAAGKLAATRALDPAVKDFGKRMVSDHSTTNQELKSLADSKAVPLPTSMSAEQQSALGKLETLIGADFDKSFLQMMIKDHSEDIEDFQKETRKGQDVDVKSFADNALPTLQHHLTTAQRLNANAKKGS